jgi:hypothetical protein
LLNIATYGMSSFASEAALDHWLQGCPYHNTVTSLWTLMLLSATFFFQLLGRASVG